MIVHTRRMGRWGAVLMACLLLAACASRPIERPREGALPAGANPAARLENGPPPTLVGASLLSQTVTPTTVSQPLASPSPSPGVTNPNGSPGALPVISGLQPAPGATLPAGDVVISARVSASSDLADVIVYIDGEAVAIDMSGPRVRVKMVSMVRSFTVGSHELRIQARDDRGQLGGYRWQFTIGTARQSLPTAEPKPAVPAIPAGPTATLFVVPTRRPTAPPTVPPVAKPIMQTPGPAPAAKPTMTPTR
jgi:hypothetical protein